MHACSPLTDLLLFSGEKSRQGFKKLCWLLKLLGAAKVEAQSTGTQPQRILPHQGVVLPAHGLICPSQFDRSTCTRVHVCTFSQESFPSPPSDLPGSFELASSLMA